jgi:hypothetical protein
MTRTDGVPLFIEELTKTVESGLLWKLAMGMDHRQPRTVRHSFHSARLFTRTVDRLASVKDGRRSPPQSAGTLWPDRCRLRTPERDWVALAQLVGAELIFQRGMPPDAAYLFKHALQEAAYASLVRSHRQQLHG